MDSRIRVICVSNRAALFNVQYAHVLARTRHMELIRTLATYWKANRTQCLLKPTLSCTHAQDLFVTSTHNLRHTRQALVTMAGAWASSLVAACQLSFYASILPCWLLRQPKGPGSKTASRSLSPMILGACLDLAAQSTLSLTYSARYL
jgi:hypothetical protein